MDIYLSLLIFQPSGAGLKPDVGSEVDSTEVKNVEGQVKFSKNIFVNKILSMHLIS